MMPSRCAKALLACGLVAAHAFAGAALSCGPQLTLPSYQRLQFDRANQDVQPRLQGVLAHDVALAVQPSELGLKAGGRQPAGPQPLPSPLKLQAFQLSYGMLVDDRAEMSFGGRKDGDTSIASGGRRYLVHLKDGKAVAAGGEPLQVLPDTVAVTAPVVSKGALVGVGADNVPTVLRGATLTWSMDGPAPLHAVLAAPARLAETSAVLPGSRVDVLRPPRVLPGAVMRVQVATAGFDFRSKPYVLCFSMPSAGLPRSYLAAADVKLVSQENDLAQFDVRVPRELEAGKPESSWFASLGPWMGRLFGQHTDMRVIGFEQGAVAIDISQKFEVTDRWVAVVVALLLLLVLAVMSFVFIRSANPLALLRRLAMGPSGSYSLANIQILLWTVLVLFALCYVWMGNGELLVVSTNFQILLGISLTTSVMAKAVDATKTPGASPPVQRTASLRDLVADPGGASFDLLRFQMLGFTLFTWVYSLASVLRSEGLPDIPENLYTLMGISSLAYVGGKFPGAPGGRDAAQSTGAPARQQLTATDTEKLQAALKVPVTGVLDEPTRAAVVKFKQASGIVPVNGDVYPLLLAAVLQAGKATPWDEPQPAG